MDADDIAYPDRLVHQIAFLTAHPEVDLCGAGALVFGRRGRPLWRFSPALEHAEITRSPFRGFPMWHPLWMGRIEWFRQWRYDENAWLAQDEELLLRSYRDSCFANLPLVLLGYRQERVTLKKLFRYKLLHIRYLANRPGAVTGSLRKLQLMAITAARLAANCVSVLGGPAVRLGHQGAQALTAEELAEWRTLWILLAAWYGHPVNELFVARLAEFRDRGSSL